MMRHPIECQNARFASSTGSSPDKTVAHMAAHLLQQQRKCHYALFGIPIERDLLILG